MPAPGSTPARAVGSATPAAPFYRPELDALRFFAFLAVYLNHTFVYHATNGAAWKRLLGGIGISGAFGVDLFFVLSSYLITELLLRERARTGRLDVRAFYVRRALRIWPLYFSFLLAMVLVGRVLPSEHMTPAYAAGFALFCGNWLYMAHPVRTLAAPLWSVSVEEQFYAVWPWVARNGEPRRVARAAAVVACAAVLTCLTLQLLGIGEPWISKNSLARADGIAAGALLAVALRGRRPALPSRYRATLLCGAVLVLVAVGGTFRLFEPGVHLLRTVCGYPLIAVCCAGVLVAVLGADGRLGAVLRRPELVYLGRISYGLYVFHQLGLVVADREFPQHTHHVMPWLGYFAVGLVVTLALAAASYRYLEQPFLTLKRRRFTVVESRPDGELGAAPRPVDDRARAQMTA